MQRLTVALAERMARLAIDNIGREYPNAPAHLLRSAADLRPPLELHPAFGGSYDWHSCVHQHWLLARLLRLGLAGAETDAAQGTLTASLAPSHIAVEATYLRNHPTFERTYGWAWLLALSDELETDALLPAVEVVRANWLAYLDRATYPIRTGTHANSAFGLILAIDHARSAGNVSFETAMLERAQDWFGEDPEAAAWLEPGGDDFLSPILVEAALMARALDGSQYAAWLGRFLPRIPHELAEPATVSDRRDPKTVHLDGLNLSRAWCWKLIGSATGDPRAAAAAERHLDAALPHLFSGEFVGEHWLASFALLALTD